MSRVIVLAHELTCYLIHERNRSLWQLDLDSSTDFTIAARAMAFPAVPSDTGDTTGSVAAASAT